MSKLKKHNIIWFMKHVGYEIIEHQSNGNKASYIMKNIMPCYLSQEAGCRFQLKGKI